MLLWLVIVAAAAVIGSLLLLYLMDQVYLDVAGRYVLVTGCDSGFGSILARSLGKKRGCHVIAGCLTDAGVKAVTEGAPPGTVTAILMDVTDTASVLRARDKVAEIVGGKGLWGLVNNAGVTGIPVPYHWLRKAEIQRILDVNLMGTIQVTNVFFPLVRKARGRIVNLASCLALLPSMSGGYSISKIGVEAFSDVMRTTSRQFGVTVHILEPGFFKTQITSMETVFPVVERVWNRLPQHERDVYGQKCFDTMREKTEMVLQRSSQSLHLVTDAMEHALCARWPWRRYMPGADVKFFAKPLSMLPAGLVDFLLRPLRNLPVAQGDLGSGGQSDGPLFAADDLH